jgi:hypothetical protein
LAHEQQLRAGPFQELRLFETFKTCLETLWTLWECTILNRSVLILDNSPQLVSHAVLASTSLIYPFIYSGHFNPYITIYDPNLERVAAQPRGWIVGGTNPLFAKLFSCDVTQMVVMGGGFKCHKHLKPRGELLEVKMGNSEEQLAIKESAMRKYFCKLSGAVMRVLDTHLNRQTNVHVSVCRI